MSSFRSLTLPAAPRYVLRRVRVPTCLIDAIPRDSAIDSEGSALLDIEVDGARIAALTAAQNAPTAVPAVDLDGHHAWPTLIDAHAHLDKGHILDRAANADAQ
jgi:cytosine deaminase